MKFRQWLETFSMGDILSWGRDEKNRYYEKGVRDAMEDNYDPPSWGSQMSSEQRYEYMCGWRSMGKRIPLGSKNSKSTLGDREWFQKQLRIKRYGKSNPGPINIIAADSSDWDDPDYNVAEG